MDSVTIRRTVKNTRPEVVIFRLEPWCEEHEMQPGDFYEVVAEGPSQEAALEIEERGGEIVVYAWCGSTVRVFDESGDPIGRTERPIVPPLPPGVTVSSFVGWMEGKRTLDGGVVAP